MVKEMEGKHTGTPRAEKSLWVPGRGRGGASGELAGEGRVQMRRCPETPAELSS